MEAYLAAQNKHRETRGLEKVKVIHNRNYQRHGTKSYVHLLNKFSFEPTKPGPYHYDAKQPRRAYTISEKIKSALGAHCCPPQRRLRKSVAEKDGAEKGEVTAEDQQNDSMYLIKVSIGTPPQNVMLDPDTGSSDTWYGDGSTASGDVGKDTLVVGGLSVEGQAIETATKLDSAFSEGTADGLLGLAFSAINTVQDRGRPDPQATPVENMIEQRDIPEEAELFTSAFYSSRDAGKASFMTFGYIDLDLLGSLGGGGGARIHWAKVDSSRGFWSVPSEACSIGGRRKPRAGNTAIMDTGTTLALMADEVVDALYAEIPGAKYDSGSQGYVVPSGVTLAELPEFKIDIGGQDFLVQKEDLVFAPAEGGGWYGGVQSRGTLPFDILGDVVLKSIYAIWDQGNARFGAVPKIEATQNLELPDASSRGGQGEKVSSEALVFE